MLWRIRIPLAGLLLGCFALLSAAPAVLIAAPPSAPPSAPAAAQPAPTRAAVAAAPERPRLVVLIVLDQFRAEYLDRFASRMGPDGFKRLLREGARFTGCRYPYAFTETSPGHATIATGTTPDRHGIVSNEWLDRDLRKMTTAIADPEAPLVGAPPDGEGGASPRRMLGDTLFEGIRRATGGKSIGVAAKARAVVLTLGASPTGAYWYDIHSGRMVSSRYYLEKLPSWVEAFDAAHLPPAGTWESFASTPALHQDLFDFARRLMAEEHLGEDASTDCLFLGLSGFDYLGHQAGPYSAEIAGMTEKTDAQLAAFLRDLDARVGRGRYWVVVSADHGVAPTRAQAEELGYPAATIDLTVLHKEIARALEARFGAGPFRLYGGTTRVWFDAEDLARRKTTAEEAARAAGPAAAALGGVFGWSGGGASSLDPSTREAIRLSSYPGRSADLVLIRAPFAVDSGANASHGTPWAYDTEVPLVFSGTRFRAGSYGPPCTPADLAPTLAAALGIPPPSRATGRILSEALGR